jgi:cell division protein FtsI (penicillin-binding protein 3)
MAAIDGYRVGGKTGTAQKYDETCRCYSGVIASFIGMAPADDPKLVVAVTIVNPRAGRYGGELGGPVFKRVMTYALQARQVPPTGTPAPRLPLGG